MLLKNKNIGIKQPLFYQTTVVKIIEEHFLSLSELERNRENVYFFFISCNKVVACDWSQGTFNSCPVFDREVLKVALLNNTERIIMFHNHPSDVCTPSEEDIKILEMLRAKLALFDIDIFSFIFDTNCQKIEEIKETNEREEIYLF